MKLALIFLAFLGLTCGKSIPSTRNLDDDLQDFLKLVPVDQIIAIATDYIANDAEVQAAVAYLQSDEFETIVVTVDALPELQNFLNFLEANGLNAIDFLNGIHDLLGIPHIPVSGRKYHIRRGVGITGLIDDVLAILPIDDLKALFNEKLETSPDFLALYNAIKSPEFQSIVQTLNDMPEYQNLLQKLREKGVDVDKIIELIRALFGLTLNAKASRNLDDDLQDFLKLVPVDQIISIATDYIANDAEVQAAVAYLQSDEFETIVVTVDALPELQNFLNFLEANGLNAIDFLNGIHDLLGIPHIPVSGRKYHIRRGVGITGLIDDVLAILPIDDLKALFNEKLETSPDFLALYNAIKSPEFQSIVQTLNAMPEYQNLLQKLREKGVDVDKIIELIRALFGLTLNAKASRNLQDDLQDFLALIPVDQIIAIATDYLANDAEVQAAVAYLQSDEFETIVVTVDALPELQNFLNFLETNGLNAIDFLNSIHDLLGIPHIPVSGRKYHIRRGVGITGLIDDVLAILPLDDLKALFNEKLETSPDFLALYNAIKSPEFQSIVQTLNAMPEYQNLLQKLREKGVDVDKIIELIRALFGLTLNGKSTRNLQDDLQDFLALIPVDQIIAIATDYLANDAEVQAAVAYLQSDEFETIVVTLDALPELQNFLNFLEANGLNAIDFLNGIHDLLGIPHIPVSGRRHHLRRGVGITGLIDDVLAILPIDDLKALFNEKLETSPDFLSLYNAIKSPEFQSIVQTLNAMPEYQNLLEKLREKGVDVDKIIELIRALFGLTLNAKASRNLQDDLQDFLALIPVDQIIAIATDYLANDAEVQAAVAYLQSDEFETIVVALDALPELQNFLNFLEANGLNAIDFLNGIHDLLGIPHIPVSGRKYHIRRGVGITGLIDDVLAILPIEDLKALFNEKLETSPDFLALYNAIRSPEFQSIVQTLNAMPEYQNLLQKLREKGVDVDKIIELIRALFGLTLNGKASRNLQDDLQDFLALIPVDQIIAIATDYLANDAEVQAAVAYLQSDEFETIVVTLDALPELQNFLNFLEANGLNAIDFLNGIHDLLGIPHIPVSGRKYHIRRGVGITGLIDDVLAILPLDDLKALFNEKLETSPDFLALYNAIKSPEFQSIVQTLNAMPEYQNLLEKLREKGVDVDKIIELIRALFGLTH